MRLTSLIVISALSFSNLPSHAFPLKPQAPPKQPAVGRRVPYSVVAVDGGSTPTSPAVPVFATITLIQTSNSIETVTTPASSTPPSIETIVATNIVSESGPPKTVNIILTQDITKTISPTAIISYIIAGPAETSTSSSTVLFTSQTDLPTVSMLLANPNPASEVAYQTVSEHTKTKDAEAAASISTFSLPTPPSTITSTFTLPTASTRTYDDGKWHTSYPMWNATSTVLSSASATLVSIGRAQNSWQKD